MSLRLAGALLAGFLLAPSPVLAQDAGPPAAPAAARAAKGPAIPWKPAECGKGRLEVLPSGLAILHLAGTPEEMGTQHGTLLRDQVQALVKDYLPRVLRGKREDALARARILGKQIPERHLREMKAMAEAAGVPADDILLGSVVVELLGLNHCSGAAASGTATADGRTVVGRNLEWPDHGILGQYGLLIAVRPEGFRPFLSAGFPAFVGVVTGMNGNGVFAAELVVMNGGPVDREAALKGLPYPVLLRRVLEESGSVADAAKIVKEGPRTVAQNLLLADPATGVVLECGAARCIERAQEHGLVVVTNYWDEVKVAPPGDPRYQGLCAAFAALGTGKVDAASMEKAVRAVSSGGLAAMMNLQCGVFLPSTLEVRIALGRPPAAVRAFDVVDGAALLGVKSPASRGGSK